MSLKEIAKRAAVVFAAEGWTWGFPKQDAVPNAVEIEKTLRYLVGCAKSAGTYTGSTGRLTVEEDELSFVRVTLQLGQISREEWEIL